MNNLQILDYALYCTQEKYKNVNQTIAALSNYVHLGMAKYFTNTNNARDKILTINPKSIECELVKHLLKLDIIKKRKGIVRLVGTKKNFDSPVLTKPEAEFLLTEFIKNNEPVAVEWLLNKYPNLYNILSEILIRDRIFKNAYTKEEIDNLYLSDNLTKGKIEILDQYYEQTIHEKTKGY